MFTVAAYALLFNVKYSAATYLSLLPLTIGVMLACSFDVSASDFVGLLSAFGSAVVFVSSNIVFKKVMPSGGGTSAHKLDKINLLLYSSGLAFLMMIPVWAYSDLGALWSGPSAAERLASAALSAATAASKKKNLGPPPPAMTVLTYYILNGTVHFAQNMLAFLILSSTSPVTYSIASLIKRIAVICAAVIYFGQAVHPVQALGITLTFGGLYLYNKAKADVEKGERKVRREEAKNGLLLPSTREEAKAFGRSGSSSPVPFGDEKSNVDAAAYALSSAIPRPAYDYDVHSPLQNGNVHTASVPIPTSFSSSPPTTISTTHVPPPPTRSTRHAAHLPPPLNLTNTNDPYKPHNHTSTRNPSYPSPPPSDSLGSPTPVSPPPSLPRAYSNPGTVAGGGSWRRGAGDEE